MLAGKTALLLSLLLVAGGVACMSSFESSFYSKFSLHELAQRNGSLNCTAGGGGAGGGVSALAGGGKQSTLHRVESLSCQIADTSQFDEAKFIRALKESIEQDLTTNKAKILSTENPGAPGFSFEYAIGQSKGRIQISGTKSGNYYNLQADLEEKTHAE